MIPQDREELYALAGEYVLGLLDDAARDEVAAALGGNEALRAAVTFWETRLHSLSALAPPVEPPPGIWERVAAQIAPPATPPAARAWNRVGLWRWTTAAATAVAAGLAIYIALAPGPAAPHLVAILHAPQRDTPQWVATAGRRGMVLKAVATVAAPADRAFELWVIPRGAQTPQPLGVIPPDGRLALGARPGVDDGGTLAISIEPEGGSPTGQPTGPVVFVGTLLRAD